MKRKVERELFKMNSKGNIKSWSGKKCSKKKKSEPEFWIILHVELELSERRKCIIKSVHTRADEKNGKLQKSYTSIRQRSTSPQTQPFEIQSIPASRDRGAW
jgi:hypothetical protein